MSVGMLCLGKHWNGTTYSYEDRRSDHDGLAGPPLPPRFAEIARPAAHDAGFEMQPDLCIMNYYTEVAQMGVHQDKDERPETIASGVADRVGVARRRRAVRDRWLVAQGSDEPAGPAVGRRARDGRPVTPALPRRDAHPAGHRARGDGAGTLQPDVSAILSAGPEEVGLQEDIVKKIQVQGVHHITIVGSTRQSAIDFWQGVLGMPFIFEQPNLGKPDENHLYFDPGRRPTAHRVHERVARGRRTARAAEIGCVEHIAFNVSRATFTQAPARLRERGIEFIQRDRGFMDSIYLQDPTASRSSSPATSSRRRKGFARSTC